MPTAPVPETARAGARARADNARAGAGADAGTKAEAGVARIEARPGDIVALVYAVFTAGLCSIVYELLIATTVVYFLGDSVRFFSLTIGLYMAAMGMGAFGSKFLDDRLMERLIVAEILLGLAGGFAVPLLYVAYLQPDLFLPVYAALTIVIGLLIGLEIPLLTRILERYASLRVSIAHVLSLDYFGALLATVAFPLLLLPLFGSFRTSLFFGLVNMSIGGLLLWQFQDRLPHWRVRGYRWVSAAIVLATAGGLVFSQGLLAAWNQQVYNDRVVHAERSTHQEIVLTRSRDDVRLYLNGHLQFSSRDEFRYHEALVQVPLAWLQHARPQKNWSVLVLGGGDGLAVRDLTTHPSIADITLVDLDPAVLALAKNNIHLRAVNRDSLTTDPRVRVLTGDAMRYLDQRRRLYDLIIADLPDPNSTETARLYSRAFYRKIRSNLAPDGLFITQATSPYHARAAFWTVHRTLADSFPATRPYHLLVPSFGDWGFILAGSKAALAPEPETVAPRLPAGLRHLSASLLPGLFQFGHDIADPGDLTVSTLDRPVVLKHYLAGWRYWGG